MTSRPIPYYHIDAFTETRFKGNPAGVCSLEKWPPDARPQQIAAENNLSETAFFVGNNGSYHLRWFSPLVEIDLYGHATLASAYVIFSYLEPTADLITFDTVSGPLSVTREKDILLMDFPARPPLKVETPRLLTEGLGKEPVAAFKARDYMALFDSEDDVLSLTPEMHILKDLDCLGIIATAPGEKVDFVSRFFAPGVGVPEDPVTGSSHSTLIPYWAGILGKKRMTAKQLSARGGELICENGDDRVRIGGKAVLYMEGMITV